MTNTASEMISARGDTSRRTVTQLNDNTSFNVISTTNRNSETGMNYNNSTHIAVKTFYWTTDSLVPQISCKYEVCLVPCSSHSLVVG